MEAADVAPVLRHSMTHLHIQIVSVTIFSTRRARGTATNLVHEVTPLTDGAMLQRMFMASGWYPQTIHKIILFSESLQLWCLL